MKFYYLFLSIISHFVCFAQKNDYVWINGGNSRNIFNNGYQWGTMIADFSNDPVEFRYDSLITMDMTGADASLCDNDGNLLMYSNGMHVHNGRHCTLHGLDTTPYSNYW